MKLSDLRMRALRGISRLPPRVASLEEMQELHRAAQKEVGVMDAQDLFDSLCALCERAKSELANDKLRAAITAQARSEIRKWWERTRCPLPPSWSEEVCVTVSQGTVEEILHLPAALEKHFDAVGVKNRKRSDD